jgi:3-oxoacid CoA-transferase subunit A
VVEAERVVEAGELPPDAVHLPGVYVDRVVAADASPAKRIERRTVRPARAGAAVAVSRTDSEEK